MLSAKFKAWFLIEVNKYLLTEYKLTLGKKFPTTLKFGFPQSDLLKNHLLFSFFFFSGGDGTGVSIQGFALAM